MGYQANLSSAHFPHWKQKIQKVVRVFSEDLLLLFL